MSDTIATVRQVLVDQLKDLYSAETQITKALPKLAKAASAPALRKGFLLHLEQTKKHVSRIETICAALDEKPTGKKCAATAGLVEEGQDAIDEEATPEAKDLLLIAAAQRVEHYEIAAYTSAIALAQALGLKTAAATLSATLKEEAATDKKLAAANKPALALAVKSAKEDAALGKSPTKKTFVRTARRLAKKVSFKAPV
ncbi:Ferritin-like metal-binding protein YciE [Verrucomicrobium sp. GAS474]|uniref:ferritin-like domain-containing protein n=1 Tax=Verrucomicrobium sp. GAS474 TaxID=1882831 RepID=UPI00087B1652|nr:ferritin-like domain-containing protein [Verrucomicrobium sp. GAS474]SDT89940.1 Ferritin-like metal-binding protein YciE [Verrucomicrobium sp. GAS474]